MFYLFKIILFFLLHLFHTNENVKSMKIISWNVNGIRAVVKKDFYNYIEEMDADVYCFQETKATPEQVNEALRSMLGYTIYANSAVRKGYSGTAIVCRKQPISVSYDMGMEEHDSEGRVITAEYPDFYLVCVYTPNSGSELLRLEYRQVWDKDFYAYIKTLEEKKPVVVCGDLNVAHRPIDLAHPAANYNKAAGYMQQEIDGFDRYVNGGFDDTFRVFYPDAVQKYSWWSYRAGARERNVGWRIDYFLSSHSFTPRVKNAFILPEVYGSDHCPVGVEIE